MVSKSVEGIDERHPNEEMLLERQFLVFASVSEPWASVGSIISMLMAMYYRKALHSKNKWKSKAMATNNKTEKAFKCKENTHTASSATRRNSIHGGAFKESPKQLPPLSITKLQIRNCMGSALTLISKYCTRQIYNKTQKLEKPTWKWKKPTALHTTEIAHSFSLNATFIQ